MLDLLFPKRCVCCDTLLYPEQYSICDDCKEDINFIEQPFCYCCGKPLEAESEEFCDDCKKHPKHFLANRSLLLYTGNIQNSIARFKYSNRREYVSYYGAQIVQKYGRQIAMWNVDALLPVPIHPKKKRIRGYNQAGLLAKEIGKQLEIPVYEKSLVRKQYTVAQKELGPLQRLKNLEKAFYFDSDSVKLKKVIIVDDIYTTGATLEACSRVLEASGIKEVYGITIAIGEGY